jgi:hypothetical protein
MAIMNKSWRSMKCSFTYLRQHRLPSCGGFCLRQAASVFEGSFDSATIETIRKNFYVDDLSEL